MRLKGYPGDVLLLGAFLPPVIVAAPGLSWDGQDWLYCVAELVGVLALSAFLVAGMLSARIPAPRPLPGVRC